MNLCGQRPRNPAACQRKLVDEKSRLRTSPGVWCSQELNIEAPTTSNAQSSGALQSLPTSTVKSLQAGGTSFQVRPWHPGTLPAQGAEPLGEDLLARPDTGPPENKLLLIKI